MNIDDGLYEAFCVTRFPDEVQDFIPTEDAILTFGGKHFLRNIFYDQKYSIKEKEKLKRLKAELSKAGLEIPNDWSDAELLRIVHGSDLETRKAFENFKLLFETSLKWIPSDYKTLYPSSLRILVKNI
jgi:hypothetical protein